MPRKKKEPTATPTSLVAPATDRPIQCAFCRKQLDPLTDDITFIGMGKWRDGPGRFHAVCSATTPDTDENPCLQNGIAWAKKFTTPEPVLFTYQQWKETPVRRRVYATRGNNGRYELQLSESHLNSIYFLETKHAPNAEKAKELVSLWQAQWNISPEDTPNVDEIEAKARTRPTPSPTSIAKLDEALSPKKKVELPSKLEAEIQRHANKHSSHRLKHIMTGGDNCKSCQISRGIRKLFLYTTYGKMLEEFRPTAEQMCQMPFVAATMGEKCLSTLKEIKKTLYGGLNLKEGDELHNEEAMKRNFAEMQLVIKMMAKYGIEPESEGVAESSGNGKGTKKSKSTS